MKSEMFTKEAVDNTARKFGEDVVYYPCMVDGEPHLFTENQLKVAHERALSNVEDIPGKTFWEALGF